MPEPHFASQRWWEKCVMCISIRSFDELFRHIERQEQMRAEKGGMWELQNLYHDRWLINLLLLWLLNFMVPFLFPLLIFFTQFWYNGWQIQLSWLMYFDCFFPDLRSVDPSRLPQKPVSSSNESHVTSKFLTDFPPPRPQSSAHSWLHFSSELLMEWQGMRAEQTLVTQSGGGNCKCPGCGPAICQMSGHSQNV